MATAKKLPSGSWRCLVYSHTERIFDTKSGTWKDKRIYESFTSDDPSRRGKADAERQAAEFQQDRDTNVSRKRQKNGNILLKDAMKKYVEAIGPSLSGTTVQGYSKEQYDSYAFLMEKKLKDITTEDLQKAVDDDTKRPSKRSTKTKTPISPKTVRNTYSYIRSVINYFYPNDNYDVRLPKIPKKVKSLIPAKTVLEIIKDTEIELPCLLACWLSYSMSEIRGIRVRDISNGYITLDRVIVDIGQTPTVKESGKAEARLRKHHIPNYIQALIDKNISGKKPDDPLITLSGHAIYMRWVSLLEQHDLPHMTFHDLRHPYVKHTTKIFSLRLMDFQAQAYPDARRKTRGACQLLRVGQSRSPVRPLCNRKRFSCLPPQSKMSWILYAISMRLSGYTSTRSISSSASSVVSVSASKIALDASLRLSCRACSSCFFFACANTAA